MKKRLLAMLLALVLVFSMIPSVVIAEGEEHVHCLCGANSTKGTVCADCLTKAVEWTAWDGTTAMADLAAGNYYLTQDITITSVQVISKDIAIDLCGNDITGSGNRAFYVSGADLSITDCTDVDAEIGKISGFANEGNNGPITVSKSGSNGGVLNIYGGKFVNNISNSSTCGVISVTAGSTLNMYGGEISGNEVVRGTIKGGTTADVYYISILGGTITGNTATGSGNLGGGAGVYSFSPVTIGGNAKVYGNTSNEASKNADIFLRNDSTYTGKLVLSADQPLKYGAKINYGLWTAEADTADLEFISGNPTKWKNVWVSYEGQKVGYADGVFFVDNGPADTDEEEVVPGVHVHCLCGEEKTAGKTCAECGSVAKEWTAIDTMPSVDDAGWYYLTANVTVAPFFANSGKEFAFCLCGHNMISAEGKRMFDAQGGAVISFTDCDGDVSRGMITGGTGATKYGSVLRANAGSTINIYNGKISGNIDATGVNDGIIYAAEGTTTTPGGSVNIYGGEISGNTCARGTIYTALGTGGKLPGSVKILGGVITGNTATGTGNLGGGAGAYSFYPIEIGGNAQIYGNTATNGPADLYLRDDQGAYIVLSDDKPLEVGANVHYGSKNADDPDDLQLVTGTPDVATWETTWLYYDEQKVGYDGSKFFVDNSVSAGHVHCLCGAETNLGSTCVECGNKAVEWTAWGDNAGENATLPLDGYYYLTKDVTTGMVEFKSGNTAICLHGNDLISKNGYKIMTVYNNATVSLTDCNTVPGKITGCNVETYGLVLRVNEGGVLNMYGGHVTGNSGTAAGDGVVYVDKGTSKVGGEFNMYGGEISGNTARRGGGVYTASGGNYPATVRILGGTITGNHSTGTGSTSGGGGVLSFFPVEIGGDAKIYGNTSALAGAEDIYLRNDDSFAGALIISSTKPLKAGAKISYSLKSAETVLEDLQFISGTPATWDSSWVSYDGQPVGYKDGIFFVDESAIPAEHVHCMCGAEKTEGNTCATCGTVAVRWKGITSMPKATAAGYYYLKNDVNVDPFFINSGREFAFCLCGHNMTSTAGKRMFDTQSGAVLSITDCAEQVGSITGSTGVSGAGMAIRINGGSTMNLWNGKITGHTGASDGVVYVDIDKNNDFGIGGTFNMYGGEISGNTSRRGAVYTALATGEQKAPVVRILGGTITGNTGTGTGNYMGGAGVIGLTNIEVGGDAKIYGNTAADGPADIYIRDDQGIKLVVSTEIPLRDGAKIVYGTKGSDNATDLQSITGTPDEATWNSQWVIYGDSEVGYADGKFFLKPSSDAHIHCLCGAEKTFQAICAKCGTEATVWTAITEMPSKNAPGYYYLANDLSISTFSTATGEFAFCLCGHTVTSAEGKRMFECLGGATISITDCGETVGLITGAGATKYGSVMRANAGSTINIYNGKISGNIGEGDGVIYAAEGTTEIPGGSINIYGGEISGNACARGTVYTALGTDGKLPGSIKILGGVITGNTGTGTGNVGGGAGVYSFYPIEIGGNAQIYGNTAAVAPADLYIRDDQGAKIVISTEVPLTEGAKIVYGTKGSDDPENLQCITGTPDEATWNNSWFTYDGQSVKYKDGIFYTAAEIVISNHDHDGQSWISVSEETQLLPYKDGYYVLDGDVTLKKTITVQKGNHIHLCLNGHTLSIVEGFGHFDLQPGAKLTVCDCTAKLVDGKYTAGKICDGTGPNGGAIRAREGSEVYLYDGIFCNNKTAGNGGVIYMNAATAEYPGAIFHMYGGMLCENYGGYGAAVRLAAPTDGQAGPTFRMEGGWICHNESPNLGGALHAAGNATVDLIGGIIEENTASKSGGAISINGTTTVNLSGTIIRNNTAGTHGAGMYIAAGATVNITGGEISGNSSKIGAGILFQSRGTVVNMSGGKITGNKAGTGGAAGLYASNNTVFNMTGGEISNNESEVGGGGMVLCGMTANITGGKITGNKSNNAGAGMAIQGSEVTLGNVVISDNVSTGSGGGIYVTRTGSICANVIIDGTQITNNTCASSGGGIFLYMNGNAITMKSGKINNNNAKDGGGVVAQREVTFTMESGEISNNTAINGGGGYYASIDSTFIMNGGSISGNYSGKSGGGVTCLRADFVQLNGGSISYNTAGGTGSAAGVYFNGTPGEMNGTWVTNNKTNDASGGGVMISSTTAKVDGVSTRFVGHLVITGGRIANNHTPRAGGGLLVQGKDTVVDMYGGSITENTSTKFAAGVYVGKNATFNMHGGEISYNVSENDVAAGIRHDGGFGNYTGGEIHHNVSPRSGGGLVIGGTDNKVTMKNVKIYANEAKVGGGFVQQSKGCYLSMENCEIYDNKATTQGAGAYVYTYCDYYATNCKFYGNVAQTDGGALWSWATSYVYLTDCVFENNEAKNQGAAIWTRGDGFFISGCTIRNNTAAGDGGAIYAGRMAAASDGMKPHMNIDNTVIENNVSGGQGGGAYMSTGAMCKLKDVQFLNNKAAAEAGAIWAIDEFYMENVTATGNQSGGEGYAVYLDDSDYDGHSYINGLMEMCGNMQIHDNPGGDLYLGKQTTLSITELGIAEETLIKITLHSGLLTQMVWGAYNYEGGDLNYTITYGNRSIVDPEIPVVEDSAEDPSQGGESAETPTEGEKASSSSAGLIVGIIAAVAVIAAAAIIIIVAASKKKKVTK